MTTTIFAVLCLDYVCLQWDKLGCMLRVCPCLHFEHNGSDDLNMHFRMPKIQGGLLSLQTMLRWGGPRRRVKTRHSYRGSGPPKEYFGGLHMDASIILGVQTPLGIDARVYTPRIIDGHGSVNYLGSLHPQNN